MIKGMSWFERIYAKIMKKETYHVDTESQNLVHYYNELSQHIRSERYWDNGEISVITHYRENKKTKEKSFFKNGSLSELKIYCDEKLTNHKIWNNFGTLNHEWKKEQK